jgi:CheY-like chemotaxis protein
MSTLLVVDDEPKIAQIAKDYLEHAGYSVVVANTGPQALELARSQHPALIVLDLKLPDLDGL